MLRMFPYFLSMLLPALTLASLLVGGWWLALPALLYFGGVPILDWLCGESNNDGFSNRDRPLSARLLLYCYPAVL